MTGRRSLACLLLPPFRRGEADELLVGPSGAGYSYLDLYPSRLARQSFARWTADNMRRPGGGMLNMINQIQAGIYNAAIEAEVKGLEALSSSPLSPFFCLVYLLVSL